MFSLTFHCAASDCDVKINWSTQKKINPPIRFYANGGHDLPHCGKEDTGPGQDQVFSLPRRR